jgi:hypothetical protein
MTMEISPRTRGRASALASMLTVAVVLTVPALSTAAGFDAAPAEARILFARGAAVPRAVQAFAWRVIETGCAYHLHERRQRSFWAYDAHARTIEAGVVYSLGIVSELTWKRTEPSAFIEMTIVDDGRLRLTSLKSSFIACHR